MPFWVYILRCADGSLYTGHTEDLEKRVAQHNAGECEGYTVARRPVKLAFAQEFASRTDALERELQVKRWSHRKKVALIRGEWDTLSRLAKGSRKTQ